MKRRSAQSTDKLPGAERASEQTPKQSAAKPSEGVERRDEVKVESINIKTAVEKPSEPKTEPQLPTTVHTIASESEPMPSKTMNYGGFGQ